MGFRSYVGREFSSPSSSLSALAPPFKVERSNFNLSPDPSVDFPGTPFGMHLNGSLRTTGSGAFGQEFFPSPVMELNKSSDPSSETHGYSSWKDADSTSTNLPPMNRPATASKDPFLLGQCYYGAPDHPVEAEPHYPSYFSSATHGDNDLVASNESWSAYQSAHVDGSSPGVYAKIDTKSTPEWGGWTGEWTNWNQGKSKVTEGFGSFSSKETNVTGSTNYENLASEGGGYFDPQDLINSVEFSPTNNIHILGKKPMDAVSAHQSDYGNHLSYNASFSKHFSQHDKPTSFSKGSSGPQTGMLNNLNVGDAADDTNFRCSSSFKMNMPSPFPNFESPALWHPSEFGFNLENDSCTSWTNASEASNKVVVKDSLDHTIVENYGHNHSHTCEDFLSLALNTNRSVSSVEKSFDTADRNNAAVDSPCWKGAPTSQYFPFEASEKYARKYEDKCGYGDKVPESFLFCTQDTLRSGSENNKKNITHDAMEHLEDSLAGSMGSSMINFASEESTSDGTMKDGLCSTVHVPTDIHRTAVTTNFAEDHELKSLHSEQHSSDILKMADEEKHLSNYDSAITSIKKCSPSGSIKIHADECSLSSQSSPKEVPTKPTESMVEESSSQILVNAMHNLSELLCFHCLNVPVELNEHDRDLLKNVVSNIDYCLSKNVQQIAQEKETTFSKPDSLPFVEVLVKDPQIKSSSRTHPNKEMSEFSQSQLGNPSSEEVKEHCCMSCESISESLSARDTGKMMKENDKMTMELKRILDENLQDEEINGPQALLYRDLWLEAEATLCSVNYKARFNRMKNEMKQCSYQQEDNTSGTVKPSTLDACVDSSKVDQLATEAKNGSCFDPAAQSSPPSKTSNKHVNDLLVRFHILKSREEDTYIVDANEESWDSRSDHNKADDSSSVEKGSVKSLDLFQDFLFPGPEDTTEGTFMARYDILTSRADHLNVAKSDWPIMMKKGEESNVDKVTGLQGPSMVDKKATPLEPHFNVKEEQGSQSFFVSQFDFLLPSSCSYDGTSSDWEHVNKEEFARDHY